MRVVGLFAGIGGIELGLQRAGHSTLALCEVDGAAQAVLARRFPDIPIYPDVTKSWRLPKGTELLTAGFPCQDLSQAGRTDGIRGRRSGLVTEVFRRLDAQEVPWVLLENVPFMLHLGQGRALDVITRALEERGYKWAYRVIDARAFGRPQRRERVFILASLGGDPRDVLLADDPGPVDAEVDRSSHAHGFYWTEGNRGLGWAWNSLPPLKGGSSLGIPSPPAIVLPDGRIVLPGIRTAERAQGFPVDWTKPAEKAAKASIRWKLVGNAVNVAVATWIGKRLLAPGRFGRLSPQHELRKGDRWPDAAFNVGEGRFAAARSTWPVRYKQKPLHEFLREDDVTLLSYRASAGFLSRFAASQLSRPSGFMTALRSHVHLMRWIEAQ